MTHRTYEVELSLGSVIYLAAVIGFSGGVVLGILGLLFSAIEGDWISAIGALLGVPIMAMASTALYAAVGFPIYRRLIRRTPAARQLHGIFEPLTSEKDNTGQTAV